MRVSDFSAGHCRCDRLPEFVADVTGYLIVANTDLNAAAELPIVSDFCFCSD